MYNVWWTLWVLPVAAAGDRSPAAKQYHVMHCFHVGMRYKVHCRDESKNTAHELGKWPNKGTKKSLRETLTNVGISASWHWKRSAQVSVRLQSQRELWRQQQIKAIKYMTFRTECTFIERTNVSGEMIHDPTTNNISRVNPPANLQRVHLESILN